MILECVIFKIEVNRKETVSTIKNGIWEFTDCYGNVKDVEYKDDVIVDGNNNEEKQNKEKEEEKQDEEQDAHEYMTYFLDYLNEDLNKIKNKPYQEIEEQKIT